MGNILQNSLDVTYEDFLKGVFGERPKPERRALKALFWRDSARGRAAELSHVNGGDGQNE